MNTIVIYTSLTKGYDDLKQPEIVDPACDYICFSNDIAENNIGIWQIRKIPYDNKSKTRLSRYAKMNPQILFPEYQYSLWIDSSIRIRSNEFYARIQELISNQTPCAFMEHPVRSCVYQEAYILIARLIGEPLQILREIYFLLRMHYPQKDGMYACGIIFRKHHDRNVKNFNQIWWKLYCRYSSRDQLSVGYALKQAAITPELIFPKSFYLENVMPHTTPQKQYTPFQVKLRYYKSKIFMFFLKLLYRRYHIHDYVTEQK